MNGSENVKSAREPEIAKALSENNKQISILDETSQSFFDKFNSVLRNEPTGNSVTDKDKPASSVPLANELMMRTEKLRQINSRLNSLLDLCEL